MKLVGYCDAWSVAPGDSIRFMVSSEVGRYRADLVRLIHGDTNPAGPGFKSEPVESDVSGEYEGRVQRIRGGSYVRVPHDARLSVDGSFALELKIWPTTPRKARQGLMAKRGAFELSLVEGHLELRVGDGAVRLERPVERQTWYTVRAAYDEQAGQARLTLEPLEPAAQGLAAELTAPLGGRQVDAGADLLMAAAEGDDGPADFYNGRIEAPRLTLGGDVVASWDFSADIQSRRVRDLSGNGLDGRTVQMPTRAVPGHNFTGRETAWRHAPEQYGAIWFHDDDLDDAGWESDVAWTLPDETPSGVYALHVRGDGAEDHIPFFVRPRRGRPTARIAFLAPTFSYLAYANQNPSHSARASARAEGLPEPAAPQVMEETQALTFPGLPMAASLADYPATPEDRYKVENGLICLYDGHTDGSWVCHSSRLRPVVNMRPTYRFPWSNGGHPHQFAADLHLVDWLHEHGYEFDVVTDEDLHREGAELLEPYKVVLTGTHNEYWSGAMLDATASYLEGGGRLMYLGGNGFYWVTELDPEEGHTVEVRRDSRAPVHPPMHYTGEDCLAATGERGDKWHGRGRAPHRMLGVGMSAWFITPGRPYVQQPGRRDPRVDFIVEGIDERELIGDFPCLVLSYGAAGFEVDRVDHSWGSPVDTVVVASASGFRDNVLVVPQAQESGVDAQADITYLEYPNGGAVFSTSSISWCGCLSYNGYDNNVSRMTRNVLDRFASA